MFNLTKLEHTLRLKSHLLSLSLEEAVKGELERLFLDKVIANLGLCISVYDIQSIDGGFIFANEGAPTYTVKFRLIIFRPYVGEIVSAKLKESNRNGLRLTLGFFDDIYVPELLLPRISCFKLDADHKNQGIWTWYFKDDEYFIDGQDEIRFRVKNVKFPEIPKEQIGTKRFAPMEITLDHLCRIRVCSRMIRMVQVWVRFRGGSSQRSFLAPVRVKHILVLMWSLASRILREKKRLKSCSLSAIRSSNST